MTVKRWTEHEVTAALNELEAIANPHHLNGNVGAVLTEDRRKITPPTQAYGIWVGLENGDNRSVNGASLEDVFEKAKAAVKAWATG